MVNKFSHRFWGNIRQSHLRQGFMLWRSFADNVLPIPAINCSKQQIVALVLLFDYTTPTFVYIRIDRFLL